jgi:hypothetical protein
MLLPVVQGASRTPTITTLDAMAEVFSDDRPNPFFNIIDKREPRELQKQQRGMQWRKFSATT